MISGSARRTCGLSFVLDWTRPDITRVDLRVEREQVRQARHLVEKSLEVVRSTQTEMTFPATFACATPWWRNAPVECICR
jgi:hypothetical protein